jgi:transcriptional regulator with XRE-family HTH domain
MNRGRKAGWDQPVGDRPDQHVGAMLHGLRQQAGVTQAEIAADLEIDQSYISRIERGKQPATDRVIRYYGQRFGAADLELYPEVVDGREEEGGVPSRLIKTDAGVGRQEGTPCQMFAGSPSGRTIRVGSRSTISLARARGG